MEELQEPYNFITKTVKQRFGLFFFFFFGNLFAIASLYSSTKEAKKVVTSLQVFYSEEVYFSSIVYKEQASVRAV